MLALVAEGRSQKQIASDLSISVKTVGAHVQNLLSKLGLHTRVEAVALAVRAGDVTTAVASLASRRAAALP